MFELDPKNLSVAEVQALLIGGVAPRPIALVSTISKDGCVNLAPFSFFNAFGSNPPVVVFSPARRGRDGTQKDTYRNLLEVPECVVQAVTYAMVEQVNLSSAEYPSGVDEFQKSDLTPLASVVVRPPRVAESPFQMECRLLQMLPIGDGPGSGNLAICEVVRFHIAEAVYAGGKLDTQRLDLVARMGRNDYARASGPAVFEVSKPVDAAPLGVDGLPEWLRHASFLDANQRARLGNSLGFPSINEANALLHAAVKANELPFLRPIAVVLGQGNSSKGAERSKLETALSEALCAGQLSIARALAVYLGTPT